MPTLNPDTFIVASADQVSCDLDGEAAILRLSTSTYYGLDRVGAAIWQQIQTPARVAAVCDALVAGFDVERATANTDLLDFLGDLMQEGLVEVVPDEAVARDR